MHYIRFQVAPHQLICFEQEPVALAVDHDHYIETVELSSESKASLLEDLRAP